MRLSTKGRYGLKAMYNLALRYGDGPVTLKTIAEDENISESYLEQIFLVLRNEKILDSIRGPKGGYMLARKPNEITVGDVLRALEGELSPAECVIEDYSCSKEDKCVTKEIWEKIKTSVDDVVDSITLDDMVRQEIN